MSDPAGAVRTTLANRTVARLYEPPLNGWATFGPRASSLITHHYEYRNHLNSCHGEGGLPYISTPTRKIFAAIQTMPKTQA